MQYVFYLASLYGRGSYDISTYQGTTSSSGGLLTNTGFDIMLVVAVACTIALVAVLVRFWRRPASGAEQGPVQARAQDDN